jgi:hypothetical protein
MTSPTPGSDSVIGTPTKERRSLESVDRRDSPAPSEVPSTKSKANVDEEEVNLEVGLRSIKGLLAD